ncbi:MAG TPA: heme o synthase [Thermomicrobiales bacterium]|nr:heme o synthase [Thermomicrobiales bacterium]
MLNVMPNPAGTTRAQSIVREYIALTKPGILSLLLFTTLCGMMVAAKGAPSLALTIVTMLGGAMAAGGANTLNCYIDRDIDGIMGRTSHRATVTGRISARNVLIFGLALSVGSIIVIGFGANWLAAGLALAGNLYYVLIYTLLLKRRTPQNIVIGGAAGAFPPLVGWAAVTGNLTVLPVLMFAIIYYWTPPHFWALALLKQGEYGRAAVPMLPNIVGEAETRKQVLLYTVILAAISVMPVVFGLGEIYFASAVVLSGIFLLWSARLYFQPSKRLARETFFYSLWYLALIFGAMVVDRAVLG